MRALIAFDKFKDALTAEQACAQAARVLRRLHPDWQLDLCPLTDGGEGFAEILTHAAGGHLDRRTVSDPLGRKVGAPVGLVHCHGLPPAVRAALGLAPSDRLAVIGLASASGLALLAPAERDPWRTSTRGVGELLHAATAAGATALLLGLGGSATNDLGLGALAALGLRCLDRRGEELPSPTPACWPKIAALDLRQLVALPPLRLACDVTNPLLGPHGATATFGPQKGLRPEDLPRLEAQAARLAALLGAACGRPLALAETPGSGAAGGIAFGLMTAGGAKLVPGFDLVSAWLDLPARLAAADLVLTGEGRFDATSLDGKGPGSLVREARRLGKPAHVFAGSLGLPADAHRHAITPAGLPLAEALPRTAEMLAAAVAEVFA